jgi:hypothetical protein
MTFVESLRILKKFLDTHPNEVITIFLENYVYDHRIFDHEIERANVQSLVLKPSDWDPDNQGKWPLLSWMKAHNKRLVFFNCLGKTKYFYNEWEHVIENQFGTLSHHKALYQRKESYAYTHKKRHLLLLNYNPTIRLNIEGSYKSVNSHYLYRLLDYAYHYGLGSEAIGRHMIPHFINVDFVNEGYARSYVRACNQVRMKYIANTSHPI